LSTLTTTTPDRSSHRQQGGQPAEGGPVPDGGRNGHERHAGQPADHRGQGALHARDDDEAVGSVEVGAHGKQTVQACDADVRDDGHSRAERPRREGGLAGDGEVRGAGRHHDDLAERRR
jgi:hypothetical protein